MCSIRDLVRAERLVAMAREYDRAAARIPWKSMPLGWLLLPAPFGSYLNHLRIRDASEARCNCFGCTGEPVLASHTWKHGERSLLPARL